MALIAAGLTSLQAFTNWGPSQKFYPASAKSNIPIESFPPIDRIAMWEKSQGIKNARKKHWYNLFCNS